MESPCPLCNHALSAIHATVAGRPYRRCLHCELVFMEAAALPDSESERARYATHNNDPADAGYRSFLEPALSAVAARCPAGAPGLDFGCGPGPALAEMLRERGYPTEIYDPFFARDERVLQERYAFVCCTEVLEHLHRPARALAQVDRLLRPGGILVAMTQLLTEAQEFESWWYVKDFTHVCFYAERTLEWIASYWSWTLERPRENLVVFGKPA